MRYTVSLKSNRDFQRLYRHGKSAVLPCVVLYARKNRLGVNRLGVTASTKLGHAVVRNRLRRRIREAYRLHEERFRAGYDLVVVARGRAVTSPYRQLEGDLLRAAKRLALLREEPPQKPAPDKPADPGKPPVSEIPAPEEGTPSC